MRKGQRPVPKVVPSLSIQKIMIPPIISLPPPPPPSKGIMIPSFVSRDPRVLGSGHRFRAGYADTVGFRDSMEDCVVLVGGLRNNPNEDYFGVFDGHSGDEASKFAANKLHTFLEKRLNEQLFDVPQCLKLAFLDCHESMKSLNTTSGTTAVVALFVDNQLYIANCGDSRAVLYQNSQSQTITVDHKPSCESEKQRILALGGTIEKNRVQGKLAVSRSLGDYLLNPYVSPEPDIFGPFNWTEPACDTDLLILACDGLWDVTTEEEAVAIASKAQTAEEAAVKLRDDAYEKRSRDNISVIVVFFPQFSSKGDSVSDESSNSGTESDEVSGSGSESEEENNEFLESFPKLKRSEVTAPVPIAQPLKLPATPVSPRGQSGVRLQTGSPWGQPNTPRGQPTTPRTHPITPGPPTTPRSQTININKTPRPNQPSTPRRQQPSTPRGQNTNQPPSPRVQNTIKPPTPKGPNSNQPSSPRGQSTNQPSSPRGQNTNQPSRQSGRKQGTGNRQFTTRSQGAMIPSASTGQIITPIAHRGSQGEASPPRIHQAYKANLITHSTTSLPLRTSDPSPPRPLLEHTPIEKLPPLTWVQAVTRIHPSSQPPQPIVAKQAPQLRACIFQSHPNANPSNYQKPMIQTKHSPTLPLKQRALSMSLPNSPDKQPGFSNYPKWKKEQIQREEKEHQKMEVEKSRKKQEIRRIATTATKSGNPSLSAQSLAVSPRPNNNNNG